MFPRMPRGALAAVAAVLAAGVPLMLAAPAAPATRTFYPAKLQGDVATFVVRGLDAPLVESARVVSGRAVAPLRRADVRAGARRGVLRVRLSRLRWSRAPQARAAKKIVVMTTKRPSGSIVPPPPAPPSSSPAPVPTPTPAPSPSLLWSDEFDGAAGSAPDPRNWTMQTGANYNGGDDHVAYTAQSANVAQDGQGHLAITVRRETVTMGGITRAYTSGRVNSAGLREFTAPARIEASIRIPTEAGLVPAVWTLGSSYGLWGGGPISWPDAGELDILESTNANPNRALYHVHGPDRGGALDRTPNRDVAVGGGYTHTADLDTSFHVYGLDLYSDRVEFRFDGARRWSVTRAQYEAAGGQWAGVFDKAQYLILNVGSLYSWVGDATFTSSRQMLVDWVRASRL